MDDLFYKTFRNISIREKIFENIHNRDSNFSYSGTTLLYSIVKNQKFKILHDKLKNNQFIIVNSRGLNELFTSYLDNPLFGDVFDLLWVNYNSTVVSLDPLSLLINSKLEPSTKSKLIKFIYNKYFSNNSNNNSYSNINNNNNGNNNQSSTTKINQIYRIYSLIDNVLWSYSDFKDTPHTALVELINQSNNYNNNNMVIEEVEHKRKKSKNETFTTIPNSISSATMSNPVYELIESIYLNKEIPLFLKYNLNSLSKGDISEKLGFIKNTLKLDIASLIQKYTSPNSGDGGVIHLNSLENIVAIGLKEVEEFNGLLDVFLMLVLYGNMKIVDDGDIYLNDLNILKINLIEKVQLIKSEEKTNQYKSFLIENQSNISTVSELITLVENIENNNLQMLFYLFECHYIYHLLEKNQIEQIKIIMNSKFEFSFVPKNKNSGLLINRGRGIKEMAALKNDCISLFFYYSIMKFSTQALDLLQLYMKYSNGFTSNRVKIIQFEQMKQEPLDALVFYNYLFSHEKRGIFNNDQYSIIFDYSIKYYSGEVLKTLLGSSELFKSNYISFNKRLFFESFMYHFSSTFKPNLELDYKKMDLFINNLCNVKNFTEFTQEQYINVVSQISPSHIADFLIYLFKNSSKCKHVPLFYNIIKQLQINSKFLYVDDSIKLYNKIDQDLVLDVYFNNEKEKDEEDEEDDDEYSVEETFESKLLYKSSILINHFFISIINLDFSTLIKILVALNDNLEIKLSDEIKDIFNNNDDGSIRSNKNNKNSLKIIKYLFSNGYLKNFDIIEMEDWLENKFYASREYLLELATGNQEFKDYLDNKYSIYLNYDGTVINEADLHYDDYDEDSVDINVINDQDSMIKALSHRKYQLVLDYINSNDDIKNGKVEIISKDIKVHASNIRNSYYFMQLFKPLIKYNWDNESTLKFMASGSFNTEIFEFLWINYFNTDDLKRNLFSRIFKKIISGGIIEIFVESTQYILNQKKEYLVSTFKDTDGVINSILLENSLIFGGLSLFKVIKSIFPAQFETFEISKSFILRLLNNEGVYFNKRLCNDVLEYLYYNNYISNLKELLGDEINNLDLPKSLTKSTFILLHQIIKLQQQQP